MDEAWHIYHEELMSRAGHVPGQFFDQEDELAEAAHDAYESTVDRLVEQQDFSEGDALTLAKGFNRTVKAWIEEGQFDFDELRERLQQRQEEWEHSTDPV